MKLVLLMSVSGSLMIIFYLLFKLLVKNRADAKWRYRILKAALFFYLVPVQAAKPGWLAVYYYYFTDGNRQAVWLNDDIVQVAEGRLPRYSMYYSWKYIYFAAVGIIFAVMLFKMLLYVKHCHTALKHPAGRNDSRMEAGVKQQVERLGIRRRISCRLCSGSRDAFTIGVLHPVIIMDDSGCDEKEMELIIRHELTHIKSWDGLVRLLGIIAAAVHFFNPLIYYLLYELSAVSEIACDEKIVSQMDENGKNRYCRLLFKIVQGKEGLYIINFGRGKKNVLKERIEMMLNGKNRKKGWQVFSGVALSFMIMLVSSVTTFAYEPPSVVDLGHAEKEAEYEHGEVDRLFVPDGYEGSDGFFSVDTSEMSFEDSDAYFVDAQGNRYAVSENMERLLCSHTFTSGKYQEHVKDGAGCTVTIYNANRCTKCGLVQILDVYSKTSYTNCPH